MMYDQQNILLKNSFSRKNFQTRTFWTPEKSATHISQSHNTVATLTIMSHINDDAMPNRYATVQQRCHDPNETK
jgi:hypothetical protein